MKDGKKTLLRVLTYIKRRISILLIALVLSAITVSLGLYIPILTGRAIDCLIGAGGVDFTRLYGILIEIAVIAVLSAALQWLCGILNNRAAVSVVRDIRSDAFAKIGELPLSYIDSHPHGELVSRIVSDAEQFSDGLLMGFTQLFSGVVTIIGTLIFMLTLNPLITAVVALLTPLSIFIAKFIAGRTYSMFRERSVLRGELTGYIEEMISGQKVTAAFSRERETVKRFNALNDRLGGVTLRAVFFSSLTNPCTRFVNGIVYAAVALVGAYTAVGGAITVGALTSFLSYANQYAKPFNEISGVITELQNSLACAGRLFELIDEPPQIPDAIGVLEAPKGAVTFRDVSFSYLPDRPLIEELDLDVASGQTVAIVGPTGCGKTTLINLLMRFYDVKGGAICIDGVDIRDVTRASLRRSFGMVLQDTWLRSGTIRENLSFGRPDATDAEIEAAAISAHAHSFISRLPDGYDTFIKGDGGALSEGQKQLLCIARVMLTDPVMLILDEATSSIDTRTERKIQSAFSAMTKGRTSFIVAHRLSTIRGADIILVMRDGHIIEKGNHDALIAANGFYKSLYDKMNSANNM